MTNSVRPEFRIGPIQILHWNSDASARKFWFSSEGAIPAISAKSKAQQPVTRHYQLQACSEVMGYLSACLSGRFLRLGNFEKSWTIRKERLNHTNDEIQTRIHLA